MASGRTSVRVARTSEAPRVRGPCGGGRPGLLMRSISIPRTSTASTQAPLAHPRPDCRDRALGRHVVAATDDWRLPPGREQMLPASVDCWEPALAVAPSGPIFVVAGERNASPRSNDFDQRQVTRRSRERELCGRLRTTGLFRLVALAPLLRSFSDPVSRSTPLSPSAIRRSDGSRNGTGASVPLPSSDPWTGFFRSSRC
jgi:hypothetical protein